MKTIACRGRETLSPEEAAAVAAVVRAGGVLLYPTDTVYGLGADPGSAAGIERIYRLKGRPRAKPLLVLLADQGLVACFAAAVPAPWPRLMRRFWPGPLTLLFPALPGLLPGVRSPVGAVALRVPGSALCRAVLAAAGGALTGTSANPAGAGSSADPREVRARIGPALDLEIDAGTLPPSRESTLVGLDAAGRVRVLREGAIGGDALAEAVRDGA